MLSFITDREFEKYVQKVIDAVDKKLKKVEKNLATNTLDPFSALFQSVILDLNLDEWMELEKNRQVQKTMQNAIGEFHQNLLGSFKDWENLGKGGSVDLENKERKIIVEIKNKHNTLNSASAATTYSKLANHLKYDKKGYTAYLVQIVPRKVEDYDVPWSPNLATEKLRDDIRRIDGESFYDLVSGETNTLERVYKYLPTVINRLRGSDGLSNEDVAQLNKLFAKAYK